MRGKFVFSCNVALTLSLQNAGGVAGFSCHDYAAGSASSEFCYSQACLAFCADQEQPAYCMEHNYISTGYCVQVSDAAEGVCLGVVGIDDAHTSWCQTTACDYAKSLQKTSKDDITAAILAEYPHHCTSAASGDGVGLIQQSSVSSSGSSCYAKSGWSGGATCKLCASPSANQCPEFGFTSCATTYEECSGGVAPTAAASSSSKTTTVAAAGAVGGSGSSGGCWAHKNWAASECALCSNPVSSQCPSFSYTTCYASEAECTSTLSSSSGSSSGSSNSAVGSSGSSNSAVGSSNSNSAVDSSSSNSDSAVDSSSGNSNSAVDSSGDISSAGESSGSSGGCWAHKNWAASECALCSNPVSSQCPSFSYTTCYGSEAECTSTLSSSSSNSNSAVGSSSNSNSAVGSSSNSGGSGACATECPENTLAGGITRPSFRGPSCYNSEYGSQFGANWVPSGKTRVEKFLPTATDFMRLIRTLEAGDTMPILSKTWGVTDCPAATAAWETFICALELMEENGKSFEAIGNAPGYTVSDLFNTGDEYFDKLELAAFFSHKMKEVARFQVWEENANGYADCTNVDYPCGAGQSYHGRGPVQISWNYNYGPFSEWWYGDKTVLLNDADKVDPEGPMGFIAAFWFWATPRDFTSGAPISGNLRTRDAIIHWNSGKLNAMYNDGVDYDSYAGLGLSTNVINGGIECTGNFDSPARRVEYFLTTIGRLGVEIPNVEDNAACLSDSLCYGLYRGCSSTRSGAKCVPTTGVCGDQDYVKGWSYNGCSSP